TVDAESDGNAVSEITADRGDSRAQSHVGTRAMANAAAAARENANVAIIKVHAMRHPGARREAAELLRELDRPFAEFRLRELDLGLGFAEMEMKPHLVLSGKLGRPLHQLRRRGAQRTRRNKNLTERAGGGVVVAPNYFGGARQDVVIVLEKGGRRKAAVRLP